MTPSCLTTFQEVKDLTSKFSTLSAFLEHTKLDSANSLPTVELDCFLERPRKAGSLLFLLLRSNSTKIQAIVKKSESNTPEKISTYSSIPAESYIQVSGQLTIPKAPIESATVSFLEISILKIKILSKNNLVPFQLSDSLAAEILFNKEARENPTKESSTHSLVSRSLKFDWRVFDLRLSQNQILFQVRSVLLNNLRSSFLSFHIPTIEVQTPKLLSGASESGATVFEVKYFKKKAYLAQSPQLYKQMLIISGFQSIFEVGPVFRAENANTHKHTTEYTSLDTEMIIKNDVSEVINRVWFNIYSSLKQTLISCEEIIKDLNLTFGFNSWEVIVPEKPVIITYKKALELLQKEKVEIKFGDDIGSNEEKLLGKIVKNIYKSDLVVVTQYPNELRAFYTKKLNEEESLGFDFIFRGEEIISGAERENDYEELLNNMKKKGMQENDESLKFYLESFKLGAPRHGGIGMGFDRLIGLFLGFRNIRNGILFPRDPSRITP